MSGIIVFLLLVLAVVAALESSNRRHSNGVAKGLSGASTADDRDLARTKLDLLALGGPVESFNHKSATPQATITAMRRAVVLTHHGRHAA